MHRRHDDIHLAHERLLHWSIRGLSLLMLVLAIILLALPARSSHAATARPASWSPPSKVYNFKAHRRVARVARVAATPRRSLRGSASRHVVAAARRHGVPVRVALAVCRLESGCRCGVRRGRAGEIGPMQVLPATARAIGASLRGCRNQVEAGVRYLRMALRKGHVCHYNSGVGRRCNRQSLRYARLVRRLMR